MLNLSIYETYSYVVNYLKEILSDIMKPSSSVSGGVEEWRGVELLR